jgi:hypothetical protein
MATRVVIPTALLALALAPSASAAQKHCRRGETAVHGIVRGARIDLRAGRGPVIACVRRPKSGTGDQAAMRMMRDERLYAPALRRFIRRRLPRLRAHDATFDRVLLRRPAAAARVRVERGSGTIVQDGITMTGSAWEILPDPDELPIPDRKGLDLEGDF